ncbi:MAG: ion transporter [Hirschia sp.]|nr:ion transporter [Hirschia sp.]MBF18199.1 ion transporter [Hirschia sp.]|tara:strand:+ start:241 stop:1101 length:861 start_codon:yes stop_codon:yes gene_type:complete
MRERRKGLNRALFWLYEGEGKGPFLFRWSLLIFDFISIAFFMWEPFHSWRGALHESWWVNFDIIIAIYITLDFAARFYIAESKPKFFRKLHNIADVFVVITLVAPVLFENLTFLRILRIIRILRAFTFLRRLKSVSTFIDRHRTVIDRVTNFVVFLFIMSALVYVNQVGRPDSQIHNQLDALYFTVTSLTTTGYGDVLLQGEGGRVLSIVVMLLGLTLFVRMLQSIVTDDERVSSKCEGCGLILHDHDAVHCKRCGTILKPVEATETEPEPATVASRAASRQKKSK